MSSAIARDLAPKFWETIHRDGAALLPSDPPWCHASGPNPYRVLLVGGTAAMGFGVDSHELGVGGGLTAVVASSTGCGAETDIVAVPGLSVGAVVDEVGRRDLGRYSAVVLLVDAAAAVASPGAIGRGVERTLSRTIAGMRAPLPVVVAVAPPLPAELCGTRERSPHPRRLAAVGDELEAIGRNSPRVGGILLPEPRGAEPIAVYEDWGRRIAVPLVPMLPHWSVAHGSRETTHPVRRQAAVQRLGLLDGSLADDFRRIVEYARLAYQTRCAAFSVFTEGETWFMTRRGFDQVRLPESETLCGDAAPDPAGLIVGDARRNPRFSGRAAARLCDIGFYAGYRIESPDGQPIGVLSVFDPRPRNVGREDLALLRDFALAAQRRLWELHRRRTLAR